METTTKCSRLLDSGTVIHELNENNERGSVSVSCKNDALNKALRNILMPGHRKETYLEAPSEGAGIDDDILRRSFRNQCNVISVNEIEANIKAGRKAKHRHRRKFCYRYRFVL